MSQGPSQKLPAQLSRTVLLVCSADHQAAALSVINQARSATEKSLLTPTHYSIHWLNAQNEPLKIAAVRELITELAYAQSEEHYFCILHAENTTVPAQHALLKTLEEPPALSTIILVTTQEDALLETIQSRSQIILCDQFDKNTLVIYLSIYRDIVTILQSESYGALIDRAERYADQAEALAFITSLLQSCETARAAETDAQVIQKMLAHEKALLEHHALLLANCNVRLTLEACFFVLKDIEVAFTK